MPDATNLRSYTRALRVEHAVRLAATRMGVAPLLHGLRRSQPFASAVDVGRKSGWEVAAQWLLAPERRAGLGTLQVVETLTADVVRDVEVEMLLTEARRELLLGDRKALGDPNVRAFVYALGRQCDENESVFYIAPGEHAALADLQAALMADPARVAVDDLMLAAMYVPMRELLGRMGTAFTPDALPADDFGRFVREQYADLTIERELAASIPQHGVIDDAVSLMVVGQYEVNPYPRWTRLDIAPGSRLRKLADYFPPEALRFGDQSFKVLIGGCATGREAVRCGIGYGPKADVRAIDLTLASLTYAARMAHKLGADNIRFLRCDIMNVPSVGERFDVVESQGVLHHMADPLKGWKTLVDVLKPGGIMCIALYSRLGRHAVNTCRQEIAELGLTAGEPDQIRRYRRELSHRYGPSRLWMREEHFPFGRDFFSLSNCRDLLFHVHEHQFTIPQLKDCMQQLGLRFHGFAYPPLPPNRVWPRFPHPADLDAWWEYEQQNPETFSHAYEFWCRKAP